MHNRKRTNLFPKSHQNSKDQGVLSQFTSLYNQSSQTTSKHYIVHNRMSHRNNNNQIKVQATNKHTQQTNKRY